MKSYGQNKFSEFAERSAQTGLEARRFGWEAGLAGSKSGSKTGLVGFDLPVTQKMAIWAEKRPENHQIGGEIKGIWPWERKGR